MIRGLFIAAVVVVLPAATTAQLRDTSCGANEYVRTGACTACPAGTTNAAGDVATTRTSTPALTCAFPFTYYGVTYNGCTDIGTGGVGSTDPWCATVAGTYTVGSGNSALCGAAVSTNAANTCCDLSSGAAPFARKDAGVTHTVEDQAQAIACRDFRGRLSACDANSPADLDDNAAYIAQCPYTVGGQASLQDCYDALTAADNVRGILSATTLAAGPWVALFNLAQEDAEKTHAITSLQWDDGTLLPNALCATPTIAAEWHGVLAKCDLADGQSQFAASKQNPFCAAIANCATRKACDTENESVFAKPFILFLLIIGGALVIIFTQCGIVAISAALCCGQDKATGFTDEKEKK